MDIYGTVTDRIIAELEEGALPWVKPWRAGTTLPVNAATNREYHGINILLLMGTAYSEGYPSSEWVTYKQAQGMGAYVRKGEKGTPVFFYSKLEVEDKKTKEKKDIWYLKTFMVFNVAQLVGYVNENPEPTGDRIKEVETFIKNTGAVIRHHGDTAAYNPGKDHIDMPDPSRFSNMDSYYATLFHELGHWSGASHRQARDLTTRFGTESYAAEELVAEMTSAFLCARFGIRSEMRHAGYIGNWLKLLKGDKRAIFTAATKAQQAADFLRNSV